MRMWGHNAQKLLSHSEKVSKCNFKSKAQATWKMFFFLIKWTVLQCRRQILHELSFFAEKVSLVLKCTKKSLLRASKNTNSGLVQ